MIKKINNILQNKLKNSKYLYREWEFNMKAIEWISSKTILVMLFVLVSGTTFTSQVNATEYSPYVGNPIHAGTGNKFQIVKDYTGSTNGLSFTRYYNSLDDKDIGLGIGWRHTYARSLDVSSTSTIYAKRADGKIFTFTKDSLGNWITDPDTPVTLSNTSTGWTYQQGEQVESYNTQGQLISISDNNGVKYTLTYDLSGKLQSVIDRFSREILFSYNSNNKLSVITFAGSESVTFTYDAKSNLIKALYIDGTSRQYLYEDSRFPNALTGRIDENNNQISNYEYDAKGRGVLTEKAGGLNRYTLVYNADGTTTVTDPSGAVRVYSFEEKYGVKKVVKIEGGPCTTCSTDTTAATYDANGFIASKTDYNGNVTTFINNTAGLQISRTEAVGTPEERTITTDWDTTARLPLKITEPGKITEFAYDAKGNLASRTETDTKNNKTRTVSYTYNNLGQVLSVDGARTDVNDITQYQYDAQGNLVLVENALGHATKITSYDATGRPLVVVDANGLMTTLSYDNRGRLKSRDTGGEITTFDYDNVGNLNAISLPNESTLTYGYDLTHRLISIKDQLGNTITYTLDAAGNRIKEDIADSSGTLSRTRSQTYNDLNQLFEMIGAQSQTTSFAYDGNGNRITVTDAANNNTISAFDSLNRLTSVTDPLNGITRYGYDHQDNLVSVTDPNGAVTSYRYDGFGNRIEQTSPDTGTTIYTYDEAGNKLSQKDAKAQLTSYRYDVLNRLIDITYDDGSQVTYSYDQGVNALGRISQVTNGNSTLLYAYDLHGRIQSKTQTINELLFKTQYQYDTLGRMSTMTLPSGKVVEYQYTNGKLTGLTFDGQPLLSQIKYEPFGPVNSWQWANGSIHNRGYDLDGQLISFTLGNEVRTLGYDKRGNITAIADSATNQIFSYDALNRLNAANEDMTSAFQQSFSYDSNGNRISTINNGVDDTYSYEIASNRLLSISGGTTSNYSYDENGNILTDGKHQYGYDIRNRMTSVDTDNVYYEHNPLGQRIFKYVRHPFDLNKDDVFNKKDIKLYKRAVKKGETDNLNDCDSNGTINKKDVKCLKKLYKESELISMVKLIIKESNSSH